MTAVATGESRRAVVTGMGVVAPTGLGAQAHWAATLGGNSGIDRITRFDPSSYPMRLAGEVRNFTGAEIPSRLRVQTDYWTHMALQATEMALADAALDVAQLPEYEMAVVTSSSSGGVEFGQREIERLWSKGPRAVSAYQSIAWFYAATTGQISIRHGMRGSCGVLVSEQAGGLDVVAQARRLLRSEDARMVITGGTDAPLSPYSLVTQIPNGLMSHRDDPTRAYLPFDADACGYVPGEGGAILVVEAASAARARGLDRAYGEIAGYAATFDPRPGSDRPPALRRAMELALDDARMAAAEIDVVFADAAGVRELDRREARAICEVFGPYGVPVTAPKTMTGRLYGGGAALDLATALLSIRDAVIPPTFGVTAPVVADQLDLVRDTPRATPVSAALVLARGYGGFNAALVVRASN
jgi:act minimal PKS chain-length factor (CLF/KS beta)